MTTIRRAVPADSDRLRTIQRRALPEPAPELLDAGLDGAIPLYVADDGVAVGYALVVGDGGDVAYVPELAVHPDDQRSGHGSRLIEFLCQHRPEAELRVTVRVVDDHARQFYEALGFEQRERVTEHFESGDGLVFGRRL